MVTIGWYGTSLNRALCMSLCGSCPSLCAVECYDGCLCILPLVCGHSFVTGALWWWSIEIHFLISLHTTWPIRLIEFYHVTEIDGCICKV